MKKPKVKVDMPTKLKVDVELEKVEILTRLFHGVSLDSLRKVELYLLPKGKNCNTISS